VAHGLGSEASQQREPALRCTLPGCSEMVSEVIFSSALAHPRPVLGGILVPRFVLCALLVCRIHTSWMQAHDAGDARQSHRHRARSVG
jgi:hypothetical protein